MKKFFVTGSAAIWLATIWTPLVALAEEAEPDAAQSSGGIPWTTWVVIAAIAVLALIVLGMFLCLKRQDQKGVSTRRFNTFGTSFTAVILAICIGINYGMEYFRPVMIQVFGDGDVITKEPENAADWNADYYGRSKSNIDDVEAAAQEMSAKLAEEGVVLLKNNNSVLPLTANQEISTFGWSFLHPVYGGTGSGGTNVDTAITPKMGLEQAGFKLNESLLTAYNDWSEQTGWVERPDVGRKGSDWSVPEMPLTQEQVSGAAKTSQTAIVWIARQGGEFIDLPLHMDERASMAEDKFGYSTDKHYLELTDEEEAMLSEVEASFENVVVVINSSNVMELGELKQDDNVDAILWVGGGGAAGFRAVGEVLSGAVNPSGRLVDTYVSDFTKDPSYVNFSDPNFHGGAPENAVYTNVDTSNAYGYYCFVQYEEGIYVGYRFYETAYAEAQAGNYPGFDYDSVVVYPFGYGLSYTTFDKAIQDFTVQDGQITVNVKVTNTGSVAGKEVVQIYYTPPYTPGGIEKSAVNLIGFAKTDLLKPNESQVVTVQFNVEDMASYDYITNKCYVLEAGDYQIRLMNNAHEPLDSRTYTQAETVIYNDEHAGARSTDKVTATNAFDESLTGISPAFVNMSRSNFTGTFPTAPTEEDQTASEELINNWMQEYVPKEHNDKNDQRPTTGADHDLPLINLRGLDYDDPQWETFLDQLTVDDMVRMVQQGGFSTASIPELGVPATLDNDGPAGLKIRGLGTELVSENLMSYPSEVVIASTWNKDLVREFGRIVGQEGLQAGLSGWYAPGLNIHRSPFSGRNFEYFSEDPTLSGSLAVEEISGAAEYGLYAFMKHFALNDQESYRNNFSLGSWKDTDGAEVMLMTWANEQAIREIYLKPFELAVKHAGAEMNYISDENGTVSTKFMGSTAIMSAFNYIGNTWAGANSALLNTVLRDEWGFKGTVVTDASEFFAYMGVDQMIRNGGDLSLSTLPLDVKDTKSATAVQSLRRAMHNLCYTIVNSNAMTNIKPGTSITYTLAPWEIGLVIGDVVAGVLAVAIVGWMLLRWKKQNKRV